MSYADYEMKVIQWAEKRLIIPNSTPKAQAHKTLEEAGELLEAATALQVLKSLNFGQDEPVYQAWLAKFKDAAGDTLVTLINACALADVDLVDCLAGSYDEIKNRTGSMNKDGIFVKHAP